MDTRVIFCAVTNSHYFPGTLAAINSVRMYHPRAPIFVFAEGRAPLTQMQCDQCLGSSHSYG